MLVVCVFLLWLEPMFLTYARWRIVADIVHVHVCWLLSLYFQFRNMTQDHVVGVYCIMGCDVTTFLGNGLSVVYSNMGIPYKTVG